MSRNVSLLGCFNDRDQKMRKMAKNTALRLAEKSKETNSSIPSANSVASNNLRGKTTTALTANGPGSQSLYAKNRGTMVAGTANSVSQGNETVKLPKVTNSSNKNIEAVRKPENAFRIVNSRDKARVPTWSVNIFIVSNLYNSDISIHIQRNTFRSAPELKTQGCLGWNFIIVTPRPSRLVCPFRTLRGTITASVKVWESTLKWKTWTVPSLLADPINGYYVWKSVQVTPC